MITSTLINIENDTRYLIYYILLDYDLKKKLLILSKEIEVIMRTVLLAYRNWKRISLLHRL